MLLYFNARKRGTPLRTKTTHLYRGNDVTQLLNLGCVLPYHVLALFGEFLPVVGRLGHVESCGETHRYLPFLQTYENHEARMVDARDPDRPRRPRPGRCFGKRLELF